MAGIERIREAGQNLVLLTNMPLQDGAKRDYARSVPDDMAHDALLEMLEKWNRERLGGANVL